MERNNDDQVRILASQESVNNMMSRRKFLGVTAGGAAVFALGGGLIAACSSKSTSSSSSDNGGSGGGQLRIFSFAEYTAEDNITNFDNENDASVTIDIFDSNEQMITKLQAAGSSSGYDVVVATGVYIPGMVEANLLQEIDTSQLSNYENIDPIYLGQVWDPENKYSVPKAWGTVGYVYDPNVITREMVSWNDFFAAAKEPGVSGFVSVLDAPRDLLGPPAWALNIPWTTTDEAQLDELENYLLTELAPHIAAFDSFPAQGIAVGTYVLSHAWNGDARFAMIDNPDLKWVLPTPMSELWIDNWVIPQGANVELAMKWINFMLTYPAAIADVESTGYDTGLKDLRAQLPADTEFLDVIYFEPSQADMLQAGAVNDAEPKQIEIYEAVKAAAGQ